MRSRGLKGSAEPSETHRRVLRVGRYLPQRGCEKPLGDSPTSPARHLLIAWSRRSRSRVEFDPETNEPSAEVEEAVGNFNPFDAAVFHQEDYRSRLDAAIDTLPPEQIRIIEMLRQGIPIDSKEPGAVTIARTLGKSEKTIRTYRDRCNRRDEDQRLACCGSNQAGGALQGPRAKG
jgi:DNA-directed RNA polymerase specialized sigma24 family protein